MARRPSHRRPKPLVQPDVDLDGAIAEMPDKYVKCRRLGHAWDSFTSYVDPKSGAVEEVLRCMRCKLPASQVITRDGRDLGPRKADYTQVPGYLLPAGSGRLAAEGRAAFRAEYLRRQRVAAATPTTSRRRGGLRAV